MKKLCSKCQQEKELSEFRKDKSRVDGVTSSCKVCMRSFYRSQYSAKYSDKYSERNKNRRDTQAAMLLEYKSTLSCAVCNENTPVCLEFHHRDPSQKDFGVGSSVGRSWEKIIEEIQKCVCLCSNCHKKVHAGLVTLPS